VQRLGVRRTWQIMHVTECSPRVLSPASSLNRISHN
jgi:hypothetical protein